jgi:hypothetical protein
MKTQIEVFINEETLEIDNRYFSFDYYFVIDGIKSETITYDSDHAWGKNSKGLRDLLINEKYAVELALENIRLRD